MDATSRGKVYRGPVVGEASRAATAVVGGSGAVKLRDRARRRPVIRDPFPWIEELIIPLMPVLRIVALRPLRVVEAAVRPLLAVHVHAAIHRAVRKRRTA